MVEDEVFAIVDELTASSEYRREWVNESSERNGRETEVAAKFQCEPPRVNSAARFSANDALAVSLAPPSSIIGDSITLSDVEDGDADILLSEDQLRKEKRLNSKLIINNLRLRPIEKSRLQIPLCRLVPMALVRPTLKSDVVHLQNAFVHGYEEGLSIFHVSLTNLKGECQNVLQDDLDNWGDIWKEKNRKFDDYLSSIPELSHLQGKMFFVCDGNHRLMAWTSVIKHQHSDEPTWHILVDSIVLEPKGKMKTLLKAMNNLNQLTENSHVKTNLAHTLYQVQKFGLMTIEELQEILTASDLSKCATYGRKSWYTMPADVFAAQLFQFEISAAGDSAARTFKEQSTAGEISTGSVVAAMRNGMREKAMQLRSRLGKLTAVANPSLGEKFMQQIERHYETNASAPEMLLEKLQMIATASASPALKATWLTWWNSSAPTRAARKFLDKPVAEDKLSAWLAKACFHGGIIEGAIELFNQIVNQDALELCYSGENAPESISTYLENWRIRLWDSAYLSIFKGAKPFKKSDAFKDFKDAELYVRRATYRYFMQELLPKKGIRKEDLPPFLSTWMDASSTDYMFTSNQVKTWASIHLQNAGWYLECGPQFIPLQEVALFNSLESSSDVVLDLNSLSGMNEAARSKAIANLRGQDQRKSERVKKLLEKARNKEIPSKDKTNKLEEQRMTKRQMVKAGKQAFGKKAIDSIHESDRQRQSRGPERSQISGTASQERLLQGPPVSRATEGATCKSSMLILNSSLPVLIPENSKPLSGFEDILSFIRKHAGSKSRSCEGLVTSRPLFDLLLVDLPDGQPVPTVSEPADMIPEWNTWNDSFLDSVVFLASDYLDDGGAIVITHPNNNDMRSIILGTAEGFDFAPKKKWLCMNRLHLHSSTKESSKDRMKDPVTTQRFGAYLLVRKAHSKFTFQNSNSMSDVGVDILSDDWMMNYTTKQDQAMNGNQPWRGPREKSPGFWKLIIEACSEVGDIVVDCTAMTGASILASQSLDRHIVALGADSDIFNALISPLAQTASTEPRPPIDVSHESSDADSEEVVPVKVMRKRKRAGKD